MEHFDNTRSSMTSKLRPRRTDYDSVSSDNQQDILLRRRRNAIAVFEKDLLSKIVHDQKQEAKRFMNNLRKSEALLKEHESMKRAFLARHAHQSEKYRQTVGDSAESRKNSSVSQSSDSSEIPNTPKVDNQRVFSGQLKEMNNKIEVPYVKLGSYTKEDLKRPSTSLELKRKAWEKVSKNLEESRSLRPASARFLARCETCVPNNVREAREKLRKLTKVRLLSQLPLAPPQIDVEQVRRHRSIAERIETKVVGEFCESLSPLKVILPRKFCLMDVNEVYVRNAEVQKSHKGDFQRNIYHFKPNKQAKAQIDSYYDMINKTR